MGGMRKRGPWVGYLTILLGRGCFIGSRPLLGKLPHMLAASFFTQSEFHIVEGISSIQF